MEIHIPDKKLKKMAEDERLCQRKLGAIEADIFSYRLNQIDTAQTLEDLRHVDGNYHELKGDRKGQWACDLQQPDRLIFEPHEKPIPTNPSGSYIWIEIKSVDITEIVNYHGK